MDTMGYYEPPQKNVEWMTQAIFDEWFSEQVLMCEIEKGSGYYYYHAHYHELFDNEFGTGWQLVLAMDNDCGNTILWDVFSDKRSYIVVPTGVLENRDLSFS